MRIEFVHVVHLFATNIALPRIALAVAALMQEVEGLVRKLDPAEQALQVSLAIQGNEVALWPRRRDHAIR